jgi:SAM-dependent methyltransferase
MSSRIASFWLAIGVLAAWRLVFFRKEQEQTAWVAADPRWQLAQLLLASFLTIFLELAVIRWIAVEIRIFAYIKNLALLVCFLGFGLGCALAGDRAKWRTAANALLGLMIIARWPSQGGHALEGLSQALGAASDVEIWGAGAAWNWPRFGLAAAVASLLLLLITCVFVPLGQMVSRQIEASGSPLTGYSWNLAGSLLGIFGFVAVCRLMLPPAVWFGVALAGFALLQPARRSRYLMASLIIPAVLLLHDPATKDRFTLWSPYQEIEVTRITLPDGELVAANLLVNHVGYQVIQNLATSFLARHPEITREVPESSSFDLPFRFVKLQPSVLIVGAGAGNDAAAAVRNGSRSIDAVEIDPAILALGKSQHPEHPYASPRVTVHLTDARNFLRRSRDRYDLIIFGALDSHTEFSDYSNMRLDNFVYTLESFREAREHLAPDGVLFLKFQVNRPWMGERLQALLAQTFGKPPLVFHGNLTALLPATCFVISPSGRVESALASDPGLAELVTRNRASFVSKEKIAITTDDWPYLYQQGRWVPRTYLSVGVLVIMLGLILYWRIPETRGHVPSLFFFGMGAGFLLLETQAISRLALYFGTTWQVNAIAIGALLTTLLLANLVAELRPGFPRSWMVVGLLASLLIIYWIPFERIPWATTYVGTAVAFAFAIPVFFAGLLFAGEFRAEKSPSSALVANMLGAVCGGLLENASLVLGMRALLLIVVGLYMLAACGLKRAGAEVR